MQILCFQKEKGTLLDDFRCKLQDRRVLPSYRPMRNAIDQRCFAKMRHSQAGCASGGARLPVFQQDFYRGSLRNFHIEKRIKIA